MPFFKIQDKNGNFEGTSGKSGKIWQSLSAFKNHIHNRSSKDSNTETVTLYCEELEVVEYELVEKRRIPLADFSKKTIEDYFERQKLHDWKVIIK